jgi:hypothetical protein
VLRHACHEGHCLLHQETRRCESSQPLSPQADPAIFSAHGLASPTSDRLRPSRLSARCCNLFLRQADEHKSGFIDVTRRTRCNEAAGPQTQSRPFVVIGEEVPCARPGGRHIVTNPLSVLLRRLCLNDDMQARQPRRPSDQMQTRRYGDAIECRSGWGCNCVYPHYQRRSDPRSAGQSRVASRGDHIGGVTPSRPIRHARPCNVPSGCLTAAMKTFAPGLRSLLSPRT